MPLTLWIRSPATYYLVPDDFDWPRGDCRLKDVLGRTREVDALALAAFEVDAAAARAFAEGRTAEIEAQLSARRGAARLSLVEQMTRDIEHLGRSLRRGDIERLLAVCGLSLAEIEGDPKRAATTVAALLDETFAAGQLGVEEIAEQWATTLRRHGYGRAARHAASAPEKLRAWLETFRETEAPMTSRARPPAAEAAAVVALIAPELTPSQRAEVQAFLDEAQPLLAVEFALQFVSDNDGWISPDAGAAANAFLRRMGSSWHPVDALVRETEA